NFAMAGTTSNFVSKPGDVFVNDTAEACGSYTTAGGTTYTASGVYADTSASTSGCLEVHTLYLTILAADTSVTRDGNDFLANDSSATSYTWIDCSTGTSVGTSQLFSATANGSYACVVAGANGCTDTSDCFTVSGIGLTESGGQEWTIYPNPGVNHSLQLHGPVRSGLSVTLYNVLGMPLQRWENEAVLVEGLAPGVYIFVLEEAGQHVSLRALVN
ncbi:MAG: T9SS C-terminal target domain-containing protein, partial [Flavobacteriia bacterium]|nr:T9SS C-terminal target domain-containing protein [Flavobacteriia bacterium]